MDWSSAHGRGKSRRKRQESPGRMTRREQQQRGFQVHHGGAGTTAAGLKAACPTTIVPFFGDQPFWGERVHARGLGPSPIPVDQFSLAKLVDAIQIMLNPQVKESADAISKAMENEDGVSGAVKAFHKQLPKKMPQPLPLPTEHGRIDSFFRGVGKVFGCA